MKSSHIACIEPEYFAPLLCMLNMGIPYALAHPISIALPSDGKDISASTSWQPPVRNNCFEL